MKKIFIYTCIFIFCLSIVPVFGCKGGHSIKEVNDIYVAIRSGYCDSKGYPNLSVNIGEESAEGERNKSKIFDLVYEPYFKSAYGLFFLVVYRNAYSLVDVMSKFNGSEVKNTYNGLSEILRLLKEYDESRFIYQETHGKLYYENLVENSRELISSLYDFEDDFSKAYFTHYKIDLSDVSNLTDDTFRDLVSLYTYRLSKVSFNYELSNFDYGEGEENVHSWLDKTEIVGSFASYAKNMEAMILSDSDLLSHKSDEIKTQMLKIFKNMREDDTSFNVDLNLFNEAISKIDLKKYFVSTDKDIYIKNCDHFVQSRYNVSQNFLSSGYKTYTEALSKLFGLIGE